MPFELLDLILVGIMIVSGLLALMRGFTREVLSLVAWGAAAVAGFLAVLQPELIDFAAQYLPPPPLISKIAVGAAAFLLVLLFMSLISVKLGDLVLESAAGPFDRTVGFAYGLVRGLLIVVVAYLGYIWLVPREKHEDWVRNAQSLPVIETVSQFVITFLPDDIAETLQGKTYFGSQDVPGAQPGSAGNDGDSDPNDGYRSGQSRVLDQLIESTQSGRSNGSQN